MLYPYLAIAIAGSYIIGSIPFGYLIARIVGRIDIRQKGSGNIGATNVGRILGKKWGVLAFALDFAKGFVPVCVFVLVFRSLMSLQDITQNIIKISAGFATIAGHIFPVFLKFKGGKGVATSAGVVTALAWMVAVPASILWFVIVLVTHYVSLGSIFAACAAPLLFVAFKYKTAFGADLPITLVFVILCVLIIIRHKSNIKRLLNGTESKVWVRKGKGNRT